MNTKDNTPNKIDSDKTTNSSCLPAIKDEEKKLRDGRKSLAMPSGKNAKNRVRYVEGTTPLKDGCWLSDN